MGKDNRLRKKYYFYLPFLSKNRTWLQTNFNKKSLLLLVEQIFRLIEMSFRNQLLLCVATVDVSCGNKLLMQNHISANINLISSY